MLPKSFWFGLAVAGACGCLTRGAAVGSNNDRGYGNGSRSLLEIITTTACSNIGLVKNYQARLDLVYTYSLEYSGVLDLLGVERAIATSVASALNTCGDANQPIYAVALSEYSAHHLIVTDESNSCPGRSNLTGGTCSLVRGITSILLSSGAAAMDSRVYTLINATLQETDYLRQYSSTKLTQAKFEKSVGDNLVLLTSDRNATSGSQGSDSSSSSGNVKGTVVAALVSFMFSAVVMYGFYYKSKDDGKGTTTAMTERIARVQAKRRQFFQQLEDDPSLATGWMVTDAPSPTHPTIAWSDLTSDSESIKSSLPLDRIDEEVSSNEDGENEGEDIEVALSEIGSLPVSRDLSPIHIDHLEFIARWNDQAEGSELASYPDEAKEEVTGNFADHYRNINNYISEPFWLEEDETPVASNRITDDGTATDVFLRRCEFYYGRDESGCNDDDDDESSTSSYLEGDENKENKLDIPNAIVRLDATANLSKSKGPSSDISNATTEGLTADTESSLASDPKLADWVRGVLQKLSGNVKLLTCGTEDMV